MMFSEPLKFSTAFLFCALSQLVYSYRPKTLTPVVADVTNLFIGLISCSVSYAWYCTLFPPRIFSHFEIFFLILCNVRPAYKGILQPNSTF